MTQNDITPAQAKRIRDALFPGLNYLARLRRRMERLGFPPGDSLFRAVHAAEMALFDLNIALHYLSCQGGVGVAPRGAAAADVQNGNSSSSPTIDGTSDSPSGTNQTP
jgi:hypothetical protein